MQSAKARVKARTDANSPARKARKSAPPRREDTIETWNMRLYVAGQSARSMAAIANLKRICEEHLPGRHAIEVIDLVRNPELARVDQIVAIPTLVRKMPVPVRRIIGDLSATEKVIISLDLIAG